MTGREIRKKTDSLRKFIFLRAVLLLLFVPCVATCNRNSEDDKPCECKKSDVTHLKKIVSSFEEKLIKMEESLESYKYDIEKSFGKNTEQLRSEVEMKIETLSNGNKDFAEMMSSIEKKIQEHKEKDVQLEKKSKDSIDQIKKIEGTTSIVDFLLVSIITVLVIFMVTILQKRGVGLRNQLTRRPVVVCFNPSSSNDQRRLSNLFLDDYSFIIIHDKQDISRIHSKVVFLFVDYNVNNIILEGTQQVMMETLGAIRRIGGSPVVIYRLHADSRNLSGGQLYSNKLASIDNHPILRELLKKNCVLSIDKDFTEYQKLHLKLLYERNL